MHVSRGYDGLSSTYANPVDKTGPVNQIPAVESALLLFQQIFVPPPEAEENPRPLIVDKVHEHYRRLHAGQFGDAKRLSSKDKQLLEAHMERLYELDRKLNVTASCGDVQPPTDDAHIWDPCRQHPERGAVVPDLQRRDRRRVHVRDLAHRGDRRQRRAVEGGALRG
jgi:hypothetical protein